MEDNIETLSVCLSLCCAKCILSLSLCVFAESHFLFQSNIS